MASVSGCTSLHWGVTLNHNRERGIGQVPIVCTRYTAVNQKRNVRWQSGGKPSRPTRSRAVGTAVARERREAGSGVICRVLT